MTIVDQAIASVRHGGTLLDIGAGIRPQQIVRCDSHLCVEPFGPYAQRLEEMGYPVVRLRALEALKGRDPVDHIVMLDVIKHMTRIEGQAVLELAQGVAKQIVVFTPLGFVAQEGDAWGMGGDEWQRHRSLWDAAGGFDEDYRDGAAYDDADFLMRLQRAGARFVHRDDLVVEHVRNGARAAWTHEMNERNRQLFRSKWSPSPV